MAQPNKQEVETGLARIKASFANPKARQMIAEVLPAMVRKYLTPERITKIVLTAASRNPLLAVCTPQSVLRAIMEVAPLGLEIGGPQGHVYLVPFFNSKIGAYETVPIPGYRGYIDLAYRTGKVKDILCEPVYDGDMFSLVRHGDDDDFAHEPRYQSKVVTHYYCRARFTDGGHHIQVMTADEVEAIRNRSRAKDNGPWVTDPVEMGKKTCVKKARKYWPQCWELAALADLDDRVDTSEYIDPGKVIDAVPEEPTKPATDALADRLLADGSAEKPQGVEPFDPPPEDELPSSFTQGPETAVESLGPFKHVGDDAKKVDFICTALLDDANGEAGKAAQTLALMTEYTDAEVGLVPGVDRFEDLSPKRLDALYGKVKRMLEEAKAKSAKKGKGKAEPKDGDLPFK